MNAQHALQKIRARRTARTRARLAGQGHLPRLSVFRSNAGFSVQLIDDAAGRTLASASTRELAAPDAKKTKQEQARLVGLLIAGKAQKLRIEKAVFDRGSYQYHGRVKALAEGAREGGLKI